MAWQHIGPCATWLAIDVPAWREELQQLGPWLVFVDRAALEIASAGSAIDGAMAAVEMVRKIIR